MGNFFHLWPVLLFLAFMLGVSFWVQRASRGDRQQNFAKDYFIGGRSLGGFVLAMTTVATYSSVSTFVGGPGMAWAIGYGWLYMAIVQVVVIFLVLGIFGKKIAMVSRKIDAMLTQMGAIVEFFSVKTMEYMIPAYYIIASAEASSNLERFDGVKYGYRAAEYDGLHDMYKRTRTEGFGEEVKRRIMLGSFVLSSGYYDAYYLKALRTKALIKKEFDEAFEKYDVLLAPAAPYTAPKLGESLKDPMAMYLGDIYTVAVNLCGLPGITVPCGKDKIGLPIGIQMIGDCFMEKKILRAAHAYEKARGDFGTPEEGGREA